MWKLLRRFVACLLVGFVGVLAFYGESGDECELFLPTRFAGGGTVASNMLTYAALWCGFVFVILQLRFVSKWMKRKFVDGPKGIRSISAILDAVYGSKIKSGIDERITSVSSVAWWVFSWMYLYLALLTGWPERCVVFEERALVLLISSFPAIVLLFGYLGTRLQVKKAVDAADMHAKMAVKLATDSSVAPAGTGSQTEGLE